MWIEIIKRVFVFIKPNFHYPLIVVVYLTPKVALVSVTSLTIILHMGYVGTRHPQDLTVPQVSLQNQQIDLDLFIVLYYCSAMKSVPDISTSLQH